MEHSPTPRPADDARPRPDDETSDGSLLRLYRHGDQDAAKVLYLRYAGRLRALARSRTSTDLAGRVDDDDIVQSVFGSFFRGVIHGAYDVPAGEELWNLTRLGYAPLRLLLGTSVYSLGISQGIGAWFSSLSRGEVGSVTQLIYEARANALEHIRAEAKSIGADGVIGIKLHIYEMGSSYIEVLAIGTAIKKKAGLTTQSDVMIPQAVIRDRDTFFDETHVSQTARKLERT